MNLTKDQVKGIAGFMGLVFMGLGFIFWNGWWFFGGLAAVAWFLCDIFGVFGRDEE